MTKKKTSLLSRLILVALGLVVAEAVVPVAITYPFLTHEGSTLAKARVHDVDEDMTRVTQVFQAYSKVRDRPDASTDEYRLTLLQASKSIKTDLGAMALGISAIQYLARHPDDKELQNTGLAMVDRGESYEKNTLEPIYDKLDRIYKIRDLSFPLWFYHKEMHEEISRARSTIPRLLIETRNGILHPKAYVDAEQKKINDALKRMDASAAPSAKKP